MHASKLALTEQVTKLFGLDFDRNDEASNFMGARNISCY